MELQEALDLIPIRHNFVTYFTSWGVTLSIILCFVIFFRIKEKNSVFQIFAWLTLFQSLIVLDIYLCYSGLMKYTLWFNDSTEPFVLMLAPLLYLFVKGVLLRKPFKWKREWYHFIPAIVYGISQIGFYTQPLSVKLNGRRKQISMTSHEPKLWHKSFPLAAYLRLQAASERVVYALDAVSSSVLYLCTTLVAMPVTDERGSNSIAHENLSLVHGMSKSLLEVADIADFALENVVTNITRFVVWKCYSLVSF